MDPKNNPVHGDSEDFGWSRAEAQLEHALSLQAESLKMLEAFIIGKVEKEVEEKMATIFERNCKTEDLGNSEEQDFGGSWEAQQRDRARSLAGPSPKALVAFIKVQVERAVEAKLASVSARIQEADFSWETRASTSLGLLRVQRYSSAEDYITSSASIPTPASAGPVPPLSEFDLVFPPIPSAGSPSVALSAGYFRAAHRFPQAPPSPPRLAPVRPCASSSLSDTWLSPGSSCSASSSVSAVDSIRLFFRDLLSRGSCERDGERRAGGGSPDTAGRHGRLPGLARATAVLDRYKVMQAERERERSRPRPPAEIAAGGRGAPASEGARSATPLPESARPAEESRSTPVSPPAKTGPVPETRNLAAKPAAGQKSGFFRRMRLGAAKVAPCTTAAESSTHDEPSLGAPTEIKEKTFFPFANPQAALDLTFQLLSSDNWEKRVEGLNSIRRLAQCHPETLTPRMHNVCLVVVREVQNLRSQVSRAAVATLGDLYRHLPRAMDPELDRTAKALLQRAGDTSRFIRQDVGVALGHMMRSCNPAHCMKALLGGSLSDRNAAIRDCSARQLLVLIETVGVTRLLDFKKELLNNFLSAVSRLPRDASQEVRNCGKMIVQALSAHKELKNRLAKFQ